MSEVPQEAFDALSKRKISEIVLEEDKAAKRNFCEWSRRIRSEGYKSLKQELKAS